MAHRADGKVTNVYPDAAGCYIRLANIPEPPKDGYFQLKLSHPNYNALYSLVVVASVNRYKLTIRTTSEIDPTQIAEVAYLTVDW